MRLSESLNKNIIESGVGGILNKFKIKNRRDALFFEDILANYVKECEKNKYNDEILRIGQMWLNLSLYQTIHPLFKKAPVFFLNKILKNVWSNLGLLDDLNAIKEKNVIKIKTKKEALTRLMGKNNLMTGSYKGILNVIFNSEVEILKASQTREQCDYVFNITNKPFIPLKSKKKIIYDKLNKLPDINGLNLKDAFNKGLLKIDEDNKIFFRGKHIIFGENTLLHLIGNSNILLDRVSHISYEYFKKLIRGESSDEEKLILIKTLLQTMGWGQITVLKNKENIKMEIRYPPYGIQIEKDNWDFLVKTILGYLWVLDKKIRVENVNERYQRLLITYSFN